MLTGMDVRFSSGKFLTADASYHDSTVVFVGCPLDGTSSFRPGSRLAPETIRQVSWGLESFSPRLDRDLEDMNICDVGDLELPLGSIERALGIIEQYVEGVLSDGKFPFLVGGEHLITLAAVRAFRNYYPALVVLQLDAHADMREEYLSDRLSHATVMRRVSELVGVQSVMQVGVRSGARDEMAYARQIGSLCTVDEAIDRAGDRPVYLTVDLDILDPAAAPGVSTPEPGGPMGGEFLALLSRLDSLRVVGCDLVELTPPYDPSQQSSIMAAKLIRELILQYQGGGYRR